MIEARRITRLLRAAEEWAWGRYHEDVVAVAHSEPACCADGRIKAVVELATVKTGRRPRRVRCTATLELDGTVSGYEAGATSDEKATRE